MEKLSQRIRILTATYGEDSNLNFLPNAPAHHDAQIYHVCLQKLEQVREYGKETRTLWGED